MARIVLKRGEEIRIQTGHPWIFDNEVKEINGTYEPADIVDVVDFKGNFLGRGFINPKSKILVRLLTRKQETIDESFIKNRISAAWEHRKKYCDPNSCRVIFGEADLLPALIVDKFGDYLSIQILALGMERWRSTIIEALNEYIKPKGIYERSDVNVREKEGLDQKKGFIGEEFNPIVPMTENGIKMFVDLENGQKTGYFLDQKDNRAALKSYSEGKRVLDTFSHTGGFALHAAAYGASEVTAVDISEHAVEFIMKNAELNGFQDKIKGVASNVFDYLKECQISGTTFDTIVLDPPAFAKNKAALEGATRGYKEINLRAMKLLTPGGILITCSCSHYMTTELFIDMIRDASRDARRTVRQLEFRVQSKDHPVLMGSDESLYLKCLILQVF